MDVECRDFRALHFFRERKIGISETNPVFSDCFQGQELTAQHIPLLWGPPLFLQELLCGSTSRENSFKITIVTAKTLSAWPLFTKTDLTEVRDDQAFCDSSGQHPSFLWCRPWVERKRSYGCIFTAQTLTCSLTFDAIIRWDWSRTLSKFHERAEPVQHILSELQEPSWIGNGWWDCWPAQERHLCRKRYLRKRDFSNYYGIKSILNAFWAA